MLKLSKQGSKILSIAIGVPVVLFVGSLLFTMFLNVPRKARVTNLTGSSATISWVTPYKSKGTVKYGTDGDLDGKAYDDRDYAAAQLSLVEKATKSVDESFTISVSDLEDVKVRKLGRFYVHHVTIPDLDPNTEYTFKVGNWFKWWGEESISLDFSAMELPVTTEFTFETYDHPDSMPTPDPAYGEIISVIKKGGEYMEEEASDSLVFAVAHNGVKDEFTTMLSSVSNDMGSWSIDKSSFRFADGTFATDFIDGQDEISIQSQYRSYAPQERLDLKWGTEDSPAPYMLGYNEEVAKENLTSSGFVSEAEAADYGKKGCGGGVDCGACTTFNDKVACEAGNSDNPAFQNGFGRGDPPPMYLKTVAKAEEKLASDTAALEKLHEKLAYDKFDAWETSPKEVTVITIEAEDPSSFLAEVIADDAEAAKACTDDEMELTIGTPGEYGCVVRTCEGKKGALKIVEIKCKDPKPEEDKEKDYEDYEEETRVGTKAPAGTTKVTCITSRECLELSVTEITVGDSTVKLPGLVQLVSKAYAQETPSYVVFFPEDGVYDVTIPGIGESKVSAVKGQEMAFYVDRNGVDGYQAATDEKNPTENEDALINVAGLEVEVGKVANDYDLELKEGINIVSFPYFPSKGESAPLMASDFLRSANRDGVSITTVTKFANGRWDAGLQYQSSSIEELSGNDFALTFGKGYLIIAREDMKLSVPGYDVEEAVPVAYSAGWNLVGIHGQSTTYTAKSLITSVNTLTGVTADNVTWWPTSKGRYEGLQVSEGTEYGFDFPIANDQGYFVRISDFSPAETTTKSVLWAPGTDSHDKSGSN